MNSTQVGDIKIDKPKRSRPVPGPVTSAFAEFGYNFYVNQFYLSNQLYETIINKLIYL